MEEGMSAFKILTGTPTEKRLLGKSISCIIPTFKVITDVQRVVANNKFIKCINTTHYLKMSFQ